jgi:hypothetical protein
MRHDLCNTLIGSGSADMCYVRDVSTTIPEKQALGAEIACEQYFGRVLD